MRGNKTVLFVPESFRQPSDTSHWQLQIKREYFKTGTFIRKKTHAS